MNPYGDLSRIEHVNLHLETEFIVTTQTGSPTGAGTDAKVFVSFFGDKAKILKRQMQKPEGGKNPFEKSSKDVFKFNEADVGKVRLVLFTDGEHMNALSVSLAQVDHG